MAQKQWGSVDQANNSPIWAPAQVGTKAGTGTANTLNREALWHNSTANGFTSTNAHSNGVTTGTYGVSANEMANASGEGFRVRNEGWQLRTQSPSGRIRYETLVAMKMTAEPHDSDQRHANGAFLFPTGTSASVSVSASLSVSPSVSSSPSPSLSASVSVSASPSVSLSASTSLSASASVSPSPSA